MAADTEGVATDTGSVRASFIIHATHFPVLSFPGWYFLRLVQRRSYAAALSGAPDFQGMYLQAEPEGFALRRHGGMTLLKCFDYPCGRETRMDHGTLIKSAAALLFPEAEMTAIWHGQDAFSADGLPCAGPFSSRTPTHFIAAGFGGFGITGSMAAAQAISARIMGAFPSELSVYDPSRSIRHSVFPVLKAAGKQTATRLLGLSRRHAPRCPHMGCKLRFVPSTASWDCPCHGSRFDSIGRIKNSPAVRPAHIRNKNRI